MDSFAVILFLSDSFSIVQYDQSPAQLLEIKCLIYNPRNKKRALKNCEKLQMYLRFMI